MITSWGDSGDIKPKIVDKTRHKLPPQSGFLCIFCLIRLCIDSPLRWHVNDLDLDDKATDRGLKREEPRQSVLRVYFAYHQLTQWVGDRHRPDDWCCRFLFLGLLLFLNWSSFRVLRPSFSSIYTFAAAEKLFDMFFNFSSALDVLVFPTSREKFFLASASQLRRKRIENWNQLSVFAQRATFMSGARFLC